MARILLGLTGSVASIKAPELHRALASQGHQVRVVATRQACHFFDPASLGAGTSKPGTGSKRDPEICTLDEDEWPNSSDGGNRWNRGDEVLHIRLREWADMLVVAPLDANTLAKFALGICDNCLTCVWRAWDRTKPCLIAPAMNTLMWGHPATARHLAQLIEDTGHPVPPKAPLEQSCQLLQRGANGLQMAAPEHKKLACGDEGMGAMASLETIQDLVERLVKPGQNA